MLSSVHPNWWLRFSIFSLFSSSLMSNFYCALAVWLFATFDGIRNVRRDLQPPAAAAPPQRRSQRPISKEKSFNSKSLRTKKSLRLNFGSTVMAVLRLDSLMDLGLHRARAIGIWLRLLPKKISHSGWDWFVHMNMEREFDASLVDAVWIQMY